MSMVFAILLLAMSAPVLSAPDKCVTLKIHGDYSNTACNFDSWIRYNYPKNNGKYVNHISVTVNHFRYAVIAYDVYDNNDKITLPHDITRANREYTTNNGFFARIYEGRSNNKLQEIIFAIRGTDQLIDWPKANLGGLFCQDCIY